MKKNSRAADSIRHRAGSSPTFPWRDYCHFLAIAKGSLMETETFLTLSVGLGYWSESEAMPAAELITEVGKMLTVLRKRLDAMSRGAVTGRK